MCPARSFLIHLPRRSCLLCLNLVIQFPVRETFSSPFIINISTIDIFISRCGALGSLHSFIFDTTRTLQHLSLPTVATRSWRRPAVKRSYTLCLVSDNSASLLQDFSSNRGVKGYDLDFSKEQLNICQALLPYFEKFSNDRQLGSAARRGLPDPLSMAGSIQNLQRIKLRVRLIPSVP